MLLATLGASSVPLKSKRSSVALSPVCDGWYGGFVGRVDGLHPRQGAGVVGEVGEVLFVQVFEEGGVVGVEVGRLAWGGEVECVLCRV
jgi:hypothetical protein